MKHYIAILLTTILLAIPTLASAQNFESIDACKNLHKEIQTANNVVQKLDAYLTNKNMERTDFLADLYEGTKILTESGDMLFKASERYEADCKDALAHAKKNDELQKLYDLYVKPTKIAYQFFLRARDIAIEQGKQKDVDDFSQLLKEYQASIEKIVAKCKNDITDINAQTSCNNLIIQ